MRLQPSGIGADRRRLAASRPGRNRDGNRHTTENMPESAGVALVDVVTSCVHGE